METKTRIEADKTERTRALFDAFKRRERCSASLFWNNEIKYKWLVEAYYRANSVADKAVVR